MDGKGGLWVLVCFGFIRLDTWTHWTVVFYNAVILIVIFVVHGSLISEVCISVYSSERMSTATALRHFMVYVITMQSVFEL